MIVKEKDVVRFETNPVTSHLVLRLICTTVFNNIMAF